jgi:hypothetical protein
MGTNEAVSEQFSYYGVAKGRKPGIYTTWLYAHKQVNRFPGNVYKGFHSLRECIDFLVSCSEYTESTLLVYDERGSATPLTDWTDAIEADDLCGDESTHKDGKSVKDLQAKVILNSVLTYVVYALDNSTADDIISCCVQFYTCDELRLAQKSLWDNCDVNIIGPCVRRRDSSVRSEVEALTSDIIAAVQKLDSAGVLPTFAVDSIGLHRIPKCKPSETNTLSMCERLVTLETRLRSVEESLSDNVCRTLKIEDNMTYKPCYACVTKDTSANINRPPGPVIATVPSKRSIGQWAPPIQASSATRSSTFNDVHMRDRPLNNKTSCGDRTQDMIASVTTRRQAISGGATFHRASARVKMASTGASHRKTALDGTTNGLTDSDRVACDTRGQTTSDDATCVETASGDELATDVATQGQPASSGTVCDLSTSDVTAQVLPASENALLDLQASNVSMSAYHGDVRQKRGGDDATIVQTSSGDESPTGAATQDQPASENVSRDLPASDVALLEGSASHGESRLTRSASRLTIDSQVTTRSADFEPSSYYKKKQRRKTRPIVGTGASNSIRGAPEPCKDIFVYRLASDVVTENVKCFMNENDVDVRAVVQMSKSESLFRSFKVSIKKSDLSKVLQSDFWPEGVNVRRFWEPRKERPQSWE